MIVKDSPAGPWQDRLIALAQDADDLPGPELERRAARLVDMARPGADTALADLVEAVQILRDVEGCPADADQFCDEPGQPDLVLAEWGRHRDDALDRLTPAGGAS